MVVPDERSCGLIKDLVDDIYYNNDQEKINPRSNFPHISLGKVFYSKSNDFDKRISGWLEMQEPFSFGLNKVDDFSSRTIYLTSSSKDQISEIRDLGFGVRKIMSEKSYGGFTPHLTLMDSLRKDRTKMIKGKISKELEKVRINLRVESVLVREKDGARRWKNLSSFDIGGGKKIYDFRDTSWIDGHSISELPPGFFRPAVPLLYADKK